MPPFTAIVICLRHCPACIAVHPLLHLACHSLLHSSLPLRYGRCSCLVPPPLVLPSCCRGFGPVCSCRAPHSIALVTALMWTPLCPDQLPRPFVWPASFRGALDHAPWRVLPRPCRTGLPRAPLPPLAHALAAPSGSPQRRPPLLSAVSFACGPRSAVSRAALARGRVLPLASALPRHALLHWFQQLLALCVRCPSHLVPANGGTHH